MLFPEKLLIVLIVILLVLTETSRPKVWNYIEKRSKSPVIKQNWPLLVTIYEEYSKNSAIFYAGTLIRKNWVLTSAQIFSAIGSKHNYIVKSDLLESKCVDKSVKMLASQHYIHPEFHMRHFYSIIIYFNDIALLRLKKEIPYCQLQELHFATRGAKPGSECKTVSWNKDNILYEETEIIVTQAECKRILTEYAGIKFITMGFMHFCTRSKENRSGVMVLGQPLICANVMYGIANLITNAEPLYSVWTRTDQYVDWINEVLPENEDESIDTASANDYGFLNDIVL